jgi:hypothetical protein
VLHTIIAYPVDELSASFNASLYSASSLAIFRSRSEIISYFLNFHDLFTGRTPDLHISLLLKQLHIMPKFALILLEFQIHLKSSSIITHNICKVHFLSSKMFDHKPIKLILH